jgi:hypothetical protein
LVWFVHAFYLIFKFTGSLRQSLNNFVRAAGDIAAQGRSEPYKLADVKFVGRHGGSVLGYKLKSTIGKLARRDSPGRPPQEPGLSLVETTGERIITLQAPAKREGFAADPE